MKIEKTAAAEGKNRLKKTGSAPRRRPNTHGASFDSLLSPPVAEAAEEPSAPELAASLAPPAALSPFLTAQAAEGDSERQRKKSLLSHGTLLLEDLSDLYKKLCGGGFSFADLKRLEARLKNRKDLPQDRPLLGLIEEIETRVEVELAKWERYKRPPAEPPPFF